MTPEHPGHAGYDEIRVITLPPPQTGAVNRLLREEQGWRLLDVRVTEHSVPSPDGSGVTRSTAVVYVLGHVAPPAKGTETGADEREG